MIICTHYFSFQLSLYSPSYPPLNFMSLNYPLGLVSIAHTCMGMGPSTGGWVTSSYIFTNDSPHPNSYSLPVAS